MCTTQKSLKNQTVISFPADHREKFQKALFYRDSNTKIEVVLITDFVLKDLSIEYMQSGFFFFLIHTI